MKKTKSRLGQKYLVLVLALSLVTSSIFGQPATPDLSSPSNFAFCQLLTLDLEWNTVATAVSYNLMIDENSGFTSPLADTIITDNIFELTGLSQGVTYYWRARAIDAADDTSSWSEIWYFTTIPVSAPAPGIIAPADGSTCQPLALTCEWDTSLTGVVAHSFQLDDDPDFSSPIIDQDWLYNIKNLSGLSNGVTYYWRAVGVDGCGLPGIWSDTASFTTLITSVATPALVAPSDAAACQALTPVVSWESVDHASGYQLEVDDNDDFSSPEYTAETPDTSQSCDALAASTVFYWRIKALGNCDVVGDWSESWSFETGVGGVEAPALSTPINNSTNQALNLNLSWGPVAGATSYDVQVDDDDDFSSPVYDTEVTGPNAAVTDLTAEVTYFWQVRAKETCSTSNWSDTWQFSTSSGTGIQEINSLGFGLGQTFPNPFSETTSIEFTIPVNDQVSIEIVNLQGKIIESVSDYYAAGTHTVKVDLTGKVQSGVYFYRMRTSDFVDTKSCIVK